MAVGPAELRTISRLLDQALALAPHERERWLSALEGSDATHRNTLAELLAEADVPEDRFLTRAAMGHLRGLAPGQPLEQAGMRVGPYRLERQIGSGGMGSVWLAQRVDGTLERAVALKLPYVTWVPGLNARLARERDILARLAHPNIARLYDAGFDEHGRPYLALEYVEGLPIDEYLQQHPLALHECLTLFKQVAAAVAYAHRCLVVHRDLKPSNVLVSADGTPHLLDFGIAKLLGDEGQGSTQLTGAAGRMLTPGYASPEQVRGEPVTVASDVYSLGVLLYEMLTGTRPFHVTGASLTELEAAFAQELVPLASSRVSDRHTQRALRGDLDTILAKALRREPDARYRTVDALVDDLDRHLNGEPVLARPGSGWYRASRFVKRHRDSVALASVALVGLLAIAGVAVAQAGRARLEAQRAQAQAERADAVRDFVIGLFDLNHGDSPQQVDLRQLPANALVERGVRRIALRYEGNPVLRAEMMGIAGTIFADIGDSQRATEMAGSQLAALNTVPGDGRQQVEALRILARAQRQEGRNDQAAETLKEAIGVSASLPSVERAGLNTALARVLMDTGRFAPAADQLNRAEALLATDAERHSAAYSDLLQMRAELQLWDHKDPAGARSIFEKAVKLTRDLVGPLSPAEISKRWHFAYDLLQFGDLDGGRALYGALLADMRRSAGDDDLEALSLELVLLEALIQHDALQDQDAARLQQLVAILERSRSNVPAHLRAHGEMVTGIAFYERGDVAHAEPLMRHMLPVLVEPFHPDEQAPFHAIKYAAMYWYALWADDRGEHGEATRLWDEISKVRYKALHAEGVRADRILDTQLHAILSRVMAGDLGSAAQRLDDVRVQAGRGRPAILSTRFDPRWDAIAMDVLIKIKSNQFGQAAKVLREQTAGASDPRVGSLDIIAFYPSGFAGLQAVVDCNTGHAASGLARLTGALNKYREQYAPNSPNIAELRAYIGLCALQDGQPAIAREMESAARRAFTEQPDVSSYYKKPWLDLARQLGAHKLAEG